MKIKETYCCSYCPEEFEEEDECKDHEKVCDQFKGEYEGIVSVEYPLGYRVASVGDIELNDILERLQGKRIKIQVLEPVLKLCK